MCVAAGNAPTAVAAQFEEITSWFEARLADLNARVCFAEVEGRPAGCALALFQAREGRPFASARHWCGVDRIAVDTSLRGHGIARALVRAVAREAAASGIEELKANTWSFDEGGPDERRMSPTCRRLTDPAPPTRRDRWTRQDSTERQDSSAHPGPRRERSR